MKKVTEKSVGEFLEILREFLRLEESKTGLLTGKKFRELDRLCSREEKLIPRIIELEAEKNSFLDSDILLSGRLADQLRDLETVRENLRLRIETNNRILDDYKKILDFYQLRSGGKIVYAKDGKQRLADRSIYEKKI